MTGLVNWFEIPAADFTRACQFYENIFQMKLAVLDLGTLKLGMFPSDWPRTPGGAVACGTGFTPSAEGAKLYLYGGEDLAMVLERVEAAGGKVAMPKTQISPQYGFTAAFFDSEGNWVGLQSPR